MGSSSAGVRNAPAEAERFGARSSRTLGAAGVVASTTPEETAALLGEHVTALQRTEPSLAAGLLDPGAPVRQARVVRRLRQAGEFLKKHLDD